MKALVADLVYTEGRFLQEHAVLIHDGRIAAVLPVAEIKTPDVEHWDGVALFPGTINAHGHSFQSLLKGFADDLPFERWRDEVLYPFSDTLDRDGIYAGALFAFAEMLLAGITTAVDFFYLNDGGNENALEVVRAAKDIGINLVLARTFYDEDAPTKAPKRYRENAGDAVARFRDLALEFATDPQIDVQAAPHSLHAASPDTLELARAAAHEVGTPWHLHVAEARYEVEQIKERFGLTPVRLLADRDLLDDSLIAVHAVWVDDSELDELANANVGVVHCPGANAFLGDGIAPLRKMLERGIRVALGPDGGCANNRQSVFDEMRQASLLAKAIAQSGDALDASTAIDMGTSVGAELLRIPAGELAPGRRADIVALDLDDLSLQPEGNLEDQIVNSMQPSAISKVMVRGELVVSEGKLVKMDHSEIRARVAETTKGWKRPNG